MRIAYLNNVRENCYQDAHISDDFTNEEQINLCKAEQYDAIFGEFKRNYDNYRQSDVVKMNYCTTDAGDDVVRAVGCYQQYVKDIRATNKTLKGLFDKTNQY